MVYLENISWYFLNLPKLFIYEEIYKNNIDHLIYFNLLIYILYYFLINFF